jgi:hypothetical protein
MKSKNKKSKNNTRKNKMKGGGNYLDYFTNMSINLPGVGSFGKCPSKQYW